MEDDSAEQVSAVHEKSGAGALALTPGLRRRQDHLWSLTAAILANWRVPDAMKDTHIKDKVKMTEKISCQPLVSIHTHGEGGGGR